MRILTEALNIVHLATAPDVDAMPTDADIAEAVELRELRERAKLLERVASEYFGVIEQIEKEREQWKTMFFEQSAQHQNGQHMLQKMLNDCSTNLRAAIIQLNFFRQGAELGPVIEPKMLASLPTDIPDQYGRRMKELAAAAAPQTDGAARRALALEVVSALVARG